MKIVVIGAGIGGLQAAKALSDGGAEVVVYEKNTRDNICYDWIDDVETKVFDNLSIPVPDGHFHTADVTFVVPFSNTYLRVEVPEETRDWSIERRPFSETLVQRAIDAGAKISFSTAVERLYVENKIIKGVIVDGKAVTADLVIDSSGVFSPFRASVADGNGLTAMPRDDEVFTVFRAFYSPQKGVEIPTLYNKKIYLKQMGENGISWCFVEPDGEVNVLIGRMGEMSKGTLDLAMLDLKKDNPIISDDLRRGGGIYSIPVRYAAPVMVCDNFATIGDSAFMTIPMNGSGIANSLRAGQLLADVVLAEKKTDVKTLWKYNCAYYKNIGAAHTFVDMMKRMLLFADGKDVQFLFDSGIIGQDELNSIASGAELKLSFKQILDKARRGITKIGVLLSLVGAITKGQKAQKHAESIPETYDKTAVEVWRKKMNSFFGN